MRMAMRSVSGAELRLVFRILLPRVVKLFRFFLGIYAVEIAEPFVETDSQTATKQLD